MSAAANYSYRTSKSLFFATAPSPEWYKEYENDIPPQFSSLPHQSQVALPPPTPQIQPDIAPVTPHSQPVPMLQPSCTHPPPPTTSQQIQSPLSPLGHLTAPTLQLPIQKKKSITLESASIDKLTLQSLEAVVERFKKLKTVGNAGALAVNLAKESIFGE